MLSSDLNYYSTLIIHLSIPTVERPGRSSNLCPHSRPGHPAARQRGGVAVAQRTRDAELEAPARHAHHRARVSRRASHAMLLAWPREVMTLPKEKLGRHFSVYFRNSYSL